MWQSTWRCPFSIQGCYAVMRVRPEHPVTSTEPVPLCPDHNAPMVLATYEEKSDPIFSPPKRTPRRRRFNAKQLELFP